jgi:hypothetical protein
LHRISKEGKSYYWLELKKYKGRSDERIFEPEYMVKHLKTKLEKRDIKLLLDAYHMEIVLPLKKEEAIRLPEIRKLLKKNSNSKKTKYNYGNAKEMPLKDPRNIEIKKIVEKSIRSTEKKLMKYDSKLIWFNEAMLHQEPTV